MLYTRAGDAGTTTTFGCDQRMSKTSTVAEALGALDEVNSYLGLCRADLVGKSMFLVPTGGKKRERAEVLIRALQEALFVVQAEVGGAKKHLTPASVKKLEKITDALEAEIPPQHAFSVSGGTYRSALLDVARTLVRKAERRTISVHEEGIQKITPATLAYLNRLSSVLFALARFASQCEGVQEEAPSYRALS
jgi:cob(I)alamin adenosyltransferase